MRNILFVLLLWFFLFLSSYLLLGSGRTTEGLPALVQTFLGVSYGAAFVVICALLGLAGVGAYMIRPRK